MTAAWGALSRKDFYHGAHGDHGVKAEMEAPDFSAYSDTGKSNLQSEKSGANKFV
jgi:hypothetical protein